MESDRGDEPLSEGETGETQTAPNSSDLLDKIDKCKPAGDIRPTDVLCCKSKQAELHPGNKVYRHLVSLNQQLYKNADRRADKAYITNKIIDKVHESKGRFIKEIKEGSNQWFELKSEFVKEKVSKALRNAKDPACPKPSAGQRPAELDSTTANELWAEFERIYSKKGEQNSVSSKIGKPKSDDELETGEKSGDRIKGFTNRDILSGRGGFVNNHMGNRVFRWLVEKIHDMYKNPKKGRDLLIDSILEALGNKGCRFLMPEGDGKSDIWYELSRKAASAKTNQIFRGLDHPKRPSHSEDESINSRKRPRVSPSCAATSKTKSKSAKSDASTGHCLVQPSQNESRGRRPANEHNTIEDHSIPSVSLDACESSNKFPDVDVDDNDPFTPFPVNSPLPTNEEALDALSYFAPHDMGMVDALNTPSPLSVPATMQENDSSSRGTSNRLDSNNVVPSSQENSCDSTLTSQQLRQLLESVSVTEDEILSPEILELFMSEQVCKRCVDGASVGSAVNNNNTGNAPSTQPDHLVVHMLVGWKQVGNSDSGTHQDQGTNMFTDTATATEELKPAASSRPHLSIDNKPLMYSRSIEAHESSNKFPAVGGDENDSFATIPLNSRPQSPPG